MFANKEVRAVLASLESHSGSNHRRNARNTVDYGPSSAFVNGTSTDVGAVVAQSDVGYERYNAELRSLRFTAVGLPLGLIVDPNTAQIFGLPENPGRYNITIQATQLSSGNMFVLNSASFSLNLMECGDNNRLDSGNSDSPTCLNDGMCDHDGDPFDGKFTCACTDSHMGDKCEATRVQTDGTSQDALIGGLVGAFVFVLLAATATGIAMRYRAHIARQKPIDFVEYWQKFKAKAPELQIDSDRKTPKEIPRRLIALGETIGQGAFGEVSKGSLNEQNSRGLVGITVAIKRAKLDLDADNLEQQSAFVDLIQVCGTGVVLMPRAHGACLGTGAHCRRSLWTLWRCHVYAVF